MEVNDSFENKPTFPPDNYLAWAIITTILCFWPFGLISIIKATDVNRKWMAGDYNGAEESSKSAKKWAIWAAIIGPVTVIIFFLLVIVGPYGVGFLKGWR